MPQIKYAIKKVGTDRWIGCEDLADYSYDAATRRMCLYAKADKSKRAVFSYRTVAHCVRKDIDAGRNAAMARHVVVRVKA